MFDAQLTFSDHAMLRCTQRNVSADEVRFIVQHGHRERITGIIFCTLRRCDVPAAYARDQRIAQLVGASVLLDGSCNIVITVRRNEDAHRRDRRKRKYSNWKVDWETAFQGTSSC